MTKFLQDLLLKGAVTLSTFVGSGTRMVVAGADGRLSTQAIPTGSITGTGTSNYLARWLTATTLGDSAIYDNGSIAAIGTSSPNSQSRLTLMGSSTYSKSVVLDSTWNYQTSWVMRNGIYSTEFNLGGSTKSSNEGGPGSLQVSTYNSSTGQFRYPITFFANSNVSFGGTGGSVPADNGSTVQVNGSLYVSTLSGTGTRMVVANAAGVLSTQAIPTGGGTGTEVDTLDSVTATRSRTTTNSISVGGVTTTGITVTNNGNLTTTNQFYGLTTNFTDSIFVGWDASATYLGYKMGSTQIHLGTSGSGNVLIRTSGNTIIENGKLLVNTSTDSGYNVDVAGTIRSNVYWSNNGTLSAPVLAFNTSNRVVLDVQGYGAITMSTLGVGGQLSVGGVVASAGQHIARGGTTVVDTPFVSYGIGRPDADYSLTNLAGVGGYYSGTAWYNGIGLSLFVAKGSDITGGTSSFEAAKITPDGAFLLGNLAEIGTYDSGSGGTNINSYLQLEGHNADGYGDGVVLKYSRGTKASPAAVQTGDLLGGYYFKAYTNGDYATQTFIESYVTGQASFAKTNLQFATGNGYNQGGFVWMTLNEDGKLLVANPGQFTDKGDYKLQVNGNSYLGGDAIITASGGGSIEFYPTGGSNATYSVLKAKLGSGLAPTLAFYGDVSGTHRGYGIYGADSTYDGLLIYRETGDLADVIFMGANQVSLPSTQKIAWASTTNSVGTLDIGLAREAAGLLQINNGSVNTYSGLKLLNLTATGLAGAGTRMVTVDSNGLLGAQAIITGGGGGTDPTPNAVFDLDCGTITAPNSYSIDCGTIV